MSGIAMALRLNPNSLKVIGVGVMLIGLAVAGLFLPLRDLIGVLTDKVQGLGGFGIAAFVVAYLAAVLLLLPTWLLSIAAGVLFGFWGLPLVIGAATLGAILAFLIARSAIRQWIEQVAKDRHLLDAINQVVATDGWKIVALLRLSPVVPFTLQNYFFGATGIPIVQFTLATLFGMIPGSALYVYIGILGRAAATNTRLETSQVVLFTAGLLATLAVVAFVARKARSRLAQIGIEPSHAGRQASEPAATISIIIPILNEEANVEETLASLQPVRLKDAEVIVVDGGSFDDTVALSRRLANTVLQAPRGRAFQMNAGARCAKGDVLLFLHADTRLPERAVESICAAMKDGSRVWGRFDVSIASRSIMLRLVAWLMNIRSRWTGIATGDQAIFVRRTAFEAVGGFPEIPLMEDIAFSKLLKRLSAPACLHERATTSARRWEMKGTLRTILLMWRLRSAYFFGADPKELAAAYDNARS